MWYLVQVQPSFWRSPQKVHLGQQCLGVWRQTLLLQSLQMVPLMVAVQLKHGTFCFLVLVEDQKQGLSLCSVLMAVDVLQSCRCKWRHRKRSIPSATLPGAVMTLSFTCWKHLWTLLVLDQLQSRSRRLRQHQAEVFTSQQQNRRSAHSSPSSSASRSLLAAECSCCLSVMPYTTQGRELSLAVIESRTKGAM